MEGNNYSCIPIVFSESIFSYVTCFPGVKLHQQVVVLETGMTELKILMTSSFSSNTAQPRLSTSGDMPEPV